MNNARKILSKRKWEIFKTSLFGSLKSFFFYFIDGFHMTSRRPCWCTKQLKSGHVGAQGKPYGDWTLFSCKIFLLYQEICIVSDHVSENDLLNKQPIKTLEKYPEKTSGLTEFKPTLLSSVTNISWLRMLATGISNCWLSNWKTVKSLRWTDKTDKNKSLPVTVSVRHLWRILVSFTLVHHDEFALTTEFLRKTRTLIMLRRIKLNLYILTSKGG